MLPLKAVADASPVARWVDEVSIHSCLEDAKRVYLVNSGAGFEAMIHGKPIVRFGHAEYDRVVPQAAAEVVSIARQTAEADIPRYAAFLDGYLSACISLADASSYARVLG